MATSLPRKLVRVTGERNGLVEFEYGVGDLSLAIELMLPPAAFEEFCRTNAAEIVTATAPDRVLNDAEQAMAWRPSDVQRRI